jgi:hypothetical protein
MRRSLISEEFDGHGQKCLFLDSGNESTVSDPGTDGHAGWQLADRILTTTELVAWIQTAQANKARIAEENRIASEEKAHARETLRGEYLRDFGGFLEAATAGKYASHALGAKNLKKELARAFPGVKFSVKSDSYTGGDSISVSWTCGPTAKAVESVSNKYQECDFNGMEDIEEYRNSLWPEIFGGAKYVSESRHFPEEIYETLGRALCALQRVEYAGTHMWGLCGEMDSFDLSSHVHQLLSRTDWPVGATFERVESTDDGACIWFGEMFKKYGAGFCGEYRAKLSAEDETMLQAYEARGNPHWCRIVFAGIAPVLTWPPIAVETPAQAIMPAPIAAPAPESMPEGKSVAGGITVKFNQAKNGVEIYFPGKPSAGIISDLKAKGWRWSRFNSCWYAHRNSLTVTYAVKLAGLTDEQSRALFGADSAGPDRFDMQVEDNMREACGL